MTMDKNILQLRKLLLLLLCWLWGSVLSAQVTVEITVLSGTADSECRDLFNPPDHLWSVDIRGNGWVNFGAASDCDAFQRAPHLQYRRIFECPDQMPDEIEVCFRAFENDPALFNPCDINPDDCIASICDNFILPAVESEATYTFALPDNQSSSGQVEFRVEVKGAFLGGLNNIPCTATDLGTLTVGSTLGDASIGNFTNYCGNRSNGEPGPDFDRDGWVNNVGVWYKFRTSDEQSDRIAIQINNDPESTGDSIFLQVGLYESNEQDDCAGELRYLMGSGRSFLDTDLDETIFIDCQTALQPNSTYYILIDGVSDNPDELFGVYGIEVADIPDVPLVQEIMLCAGESFDVFDQTYTETGNYVDTITLPTGCDSIVMTNLSVLEPLQIDFQQIASATGIGIRNGVVEVTALGGSGTYNFMWSDSNNDSSRNNLIGGATYGVTVTDTNGCSEQISIEIAYIEALTAIIQNDTLACFGDQNGQLRLTTIAGVAPYQYAWQAMTEQLSGTGLFEGNEVLIDNLPSGEYEIIITDSLGTSVSVTGSIIAPPALTTQVLAQSSTTCFGSCDATLSLDIQGGTPPYRNTPDISENSRFSTTLSNLCAGVFTTPIFDANGCSTTITTTLEAPAPLEISLLNQKEVSCFGGNDGSIEVMTNEANSTFEWSNGSTSNTVDSLIAGTYAITATNANGCKDTLNLDINQPNQPLQASIEILSSIQCFGGSDGKLSVDIDGAGSTFSYNWNVEATSATIENLNAGNYTVQITNEKGCVATDSIVLQQPENLEFIYATKDIGCLDVPNAGQIIITDTKGANPPFNFSVDGVQFTPQPIIGNLNEGVYKLTIQDANDCEWNETVEIIGPPILMVDLGEDVVVDLGTSITLTANTNGENVEYTWQSTDSLSCTNCPEVTLTPFNAATYAVQIFDPLTQCSAADEITVFVDKTRNVFIPNVFSPNGDGQNDTFTIFGGNDVEKVLQFKVFSRTGALVYELADFLPNNNQIGWNGIANGTALASGLYVYFAEIQFIDGAVEQFTGDVMLVR